MKGRYIFPILLLFVFCCSPIKNEVFHSDVRCEQKNIIVFMDGTGNKLSEETNIGRLWNSLDPSRPNSVAVYLEGVGTNNFWGGGTGAGTSTRIQMAYEFICRNYQPGDRIYLFGFSRGAMLARSVAGLIYTAGILNFQGLIKSKDINDIIDDIYGEYRAKKDLAYKKNKIDAQIEEYNKFALRKGKIRRFNDQVMIEALGLFDTVEAFGAPDRKENNCCPNRYHVDQICNIKKIYHALSLDDNRAKLFTPVFASCPCMYESLCDDYPSFKVMDKVEEVWFRGAHSDVGGGNTISAYAGNWMLSRFKKYEIFKDTSYASDFADVQNAEKENLKGLYAHNKRHQSLINNHDIAKSHQAKVKIHQSALAFLEQRKKLSGYDSKWYMTTIFNDCFDQSNYQFRLKDSCATIDVVYDEID